MNLVPRFEEAREIVKGDHQDVLRLLTRYDLGIRNKK
jgi:hypothetical protein